MFLKPANNLDPGLKVRFQKINQDVFLSKATFPDKKRYDIARDKITAFFPGQLDDHRDKPLLTNISISIDQEADTLPPKPILVKVRAKKVPFDKKSRLYARLQTSGSLHIGNYNLGETILELKPKPPSDQWNKMEEAEFTFHLTGQKSPFTGFFFEQMTQSGGEYILTISLSSQESIWTKRKVVKFRYENGNILPVTS